MAEQQANFRPSDVQVGDTVGTLLMLSTQMRGRGRRYWTCICTACNADRSVRADHLVRYVGLPCQCRPHSRHGLSHLREYGIWSRMVDRCHDSNADNYRFYGGIGRYVCRGWRDSVQSFIVDMGNAPSDQHSLDRIDTEGNYTCGHCDDCKARNQPANCRWATKDEQVRNARNNRHYTHNGETLILKDWARRVGIGYQTLHARIERGWTFEQAISTPKMTDWSRGKRGDGNGPQYKSPPG